MDVAIPLLVVLISGAVGGIVGVTSSYFDQPHRRGRPNPAPRLPQRRSHSRPLLRVWRSLGRCLVRIHPLLNRHQISYLLTASSILFSSGCSVTIGTTTSGSEVTLGSSAIIGAYGISGELHVSSSEFKATIYCVTWSEKAPDDRAKNAALNKCKDDLAGMLADPGVAYASEFQDYKPRDVYDTGRWSTIGRRASKAVLVTGVTIGAAGDFVVEVTGTVPIKRAPPTHHN